MKTYLVRFGSSVGQWRFNPLEFEIAEVELQPLGSGEVRVRNTWMSVIVYAWPMKITKLSPPFQIEKLSKARRR